ncbi:hypothetical protein D3C87_2050600 [compost metagenome]
MNRRVADLDGVNGIGMHQLVDLMPALFVHDQKTQRLDAAAGGAHAATEKARRQ